MSEIKLLPCPFCGVELHKHHRYYHHEINGCLFDDYEFFEEDFEKWNTRKPMQEIVERLEEEKDSCYKEWLETPLSYEYGKYKESKRICELVKEVGGMNE